jgi:hypothetical protein
LNPLRGEINEKEKTNETKGAQAVALALGIVRAAIHDLSNSCGK